MADSDELLPSIDKRKELKYPAYDLEAVKNYLRRMQDEQDCYKSWITRLEQAIYDYDEGAITVIQLSLTVIKINQEIMLARELHKGLEFYYERNNW